MRVAIDTQQNRREYVSTPFELGDPAMDVLAEHGLGSHVFEHIATDIGCSNNLSCLYAVVVGRRSADGS